MPKIWKVYLAGEIHSNWREEVKEECEALDLHVEFSAPVTDHPASDDCGISILGDEEKAYWKDHKGGLINSIRTRTHLKDADVVVVRFGDKYKQWNAAFDAGYAAALGKPLIVIHPEEYTHALKELDAAASAVCDKNTQVAQVLEYVTRKV